MRLRWMFDLVPMWFRTHGPLKRFYWQEDELREARKRAREVAESLGIEVRRDV